MNENESMFQPELGNFATDDTNAVVVPSAVENSYNPVPDTEQIPCYTFSCGDCHTVYSTIQEASGNICVFCGGKNVQKIESSDFRSYLVVPFTQTLEDAISEYKKKLRLNPFEPFSFVKKSTIAQMKKIYIPCMLYDFNVAGSVVFLAADKASKVPNAPMQKFESLYTTNFDYSNLLMSQYSKIGDSYLSTLNEYTFSDLTDLKLEQIGDSYLISGDADLEQMLESAREKVGKHSVHIVRENIPHELKKLQNNNTVTSNLSIRKVFVPMYYINLKHKGKAHIFLMNGQNGKSIIDLPMSGASIFVFSVFVFVVIFLLVSLIAYFI